MEDFRFWITFSIAALSRFPICERGVARARVPSAKKPRSEITRENCIIRIRKQFGTETSLSDMKSGTNDC